MKKILIYLLLLTSAVALAGCDSKDNNIIEEPVVPDGINVNHMVYNGDENDMEIEKLASIIGYYYGDKPNLTLIEFAYRFAGQYCVFPKTEPRSNQLDQLSQQEPSLVEKWNDGELYVIKKGRDFITADDYVSERYFAGYYTDIYANKTVRGFVIFSPRLIVWVYDTKTKDDLLKAYKGILTMSSRHEQGIKSGGCYKYYFDCKLNDSEQVLKLSNTIYLRNDVKCAEPGMLAPINYN